MRGSSPGQEQRRGRASGMGPPFRAHRIARAVMSGTAGGASGAGGRGRGRAGRRRGGGGGVVGGGAGVRGARASTVWDHIRNNQKPEINQHYGPRSNRAETGLA